MEDDKLLIQICQGDKAAFNLLYERYWEQLFVYVARVIKDKDEAADIIQDVFVSIWTRREELSGIRSLSAYLFTAARFASYLYLKKLAKREQLGSVLASTFDEELNEVEEMYDAREIGLLIDRHIETLPGKMREVFVLSRKEQLSHKEISYMLQISEKTVKKQIQNALRVLRLRFQKESTFVFLAIMIHLR